MTTRQIAGLTNIVSLGAAKLPAVSSGSIPICSFPAVAADRSLRFVDLNDGLSNGVTSIATTVSAPMANLPALTSATCVRQNGVAAGIATCLAIDTGGYVWAWGNNQHGQLGNGTTTGVTIPIQVGGLSSVVAVDLAGDTAFALTSDGQLYSWGAYNPDVLGRYDDSSGLPIGRTPCHR